MIEQAIALLGHPVPLWALVVVALAVWFVLRDTDHGSRQDWMSRSYDGKGGSL